MVYATFVISTTAVSSAPTGVIDISGFPVAATAGGANGCVIGYSKGITFDSGYTQIVGRLAVADSVMRVVEMGSNKTAAGVDAANINWATFELHGSCVYWVGPA